MTQVAAIAEARRRFLATLLDRVLTAPGGIPTNADRGSRASVEIANGILERIGSEVGLTERLAGQMSGHAFEDICAEFVSETFHEFSDLRPGNWHVVRVGGDKGTGLHIAQFEQFSHLVALELAAKKDRQLAAALRSDYTIRPDIVVYREPETDEQINRNSVLVDDGCARRTPLRRRNQQELLLHASISSKWTIRSDRVQNARAEALNLIRNRKGRAPHIMVVTGEPLPSRIASIALGTGDIDCVYHFALPELIDTLNHLDYPDARDSLEIMVDGKRLRDISDLPLDLLI